MQRRWLLIGGAVLGLCLCALLFFLALYGHVGAWVIRSRVIDKLEARLGREVVVGDIEVRRGLAVLEDIVIKGPNDKGEPLARINRVEAEFAFWPSLVGSVEIGRVAVEGVRVAAVRSRQGDNFSDLVERLRGKSGAAQGEGEGGGGLGVRPDSLQVRGATIQMRDLASGLTLVGEGVEADAESQGQLKVTLGDLALLTSIGPYASVQNVVMTADAKAALDTASVQVGSGEVHLWQGMVLTGVTGTVAQGEKAGRLVIQFAGGYGGAKGTLWEASGWLDPRSEAGSLLVKADRFTFDRIASVLENSMVRDFEKTSINAELRLDLEKDVLSFQGLVDLSGLNVFHPMLSEETVRDISFRGDLEGSYDRRARVMKLVKAELSTRGVNYGLTGALELAHGLEPDGSPRKFRRFDARLTIPPVKCQAMLDSIPGELVPHLVGFKMSGTFATDVFVDVDWADLQATRLDGSIGIRGCKVKQAPKEMDAKRLEESFDHEVEVAPDKWERITIGPENPDFVPLIEVSPYLIKSLMTTEDSSFYRHRGFITREFRSALIKNLEAGYFRYGASSITMQMVKNVLLYRDKTLARKLQELFLTWYLESELEKDRILEIYVNAIEYGPALYGIKPAAFQYFGKPPFDLTPTESAFFSSILPAPKRRYKQFCKDRLTTWTLRKVERILALMYKRERLTDEEYQLAQMTPLVFQPDKSGGFCTKKFPKWGIR
ncbi:MAG TPA: transglycosylase domain-containing protein [Kofleriaceae bacterium]|nr:transglycosylase domain-containing protein [Kofleriaceae bacterium]